MTDTNGIMIYANSKFSVLTEYAPEKVLGNETPFLGYGYFTATLVSFIAGFYMLDRKIKRIESLTFALQPLGVHREEGISRFRIYPLNIVCH